MSAVYAVVFADGAAFEDAGGGLPVVFRDLGGVPVVVRTVRQLLAHPEVVRVVVTCPPAAADRLAAVLRDGDLDGPVTTVVAPVASDEAIHDGLAALQDIAAEDDVVLIHDAARPLIDQALITANIAAAREHAAAVTVGPATEGVARVVGDAVVQVHPTDGEMLVLKAPQTFRYGVVWDLYTWAHDSVGVHSTSPAHLCRYSGVKPRAVRGSTANIRITDDVDLEVGAVLLAAAGADVAGGRA
ncbi:2-C-methyl-D-erythritol 4-phosphate cytidylyltransferase [Nocardioides sp. BP30]|uniref:IspD/TarI family cytidylyltransferase n=1 Tax=Nocardioides sp. BP30 TaxID=3036374 RepID=UPI0024683618|nr:2-C-methyl-D-erythritol 4-phosphate cytidylyltransferase [Nocardioides sp. BP30]WGL51916.1 2-C-methyl-D-erythritol 4-phosphate cytidylyltransferase [Nocardioides sp. BP30]